MRPPEPIFLVGLTSSARDDFFYERVVRLILPRKAELASEIVRHDPRLATSPDSRVYENPYKLSN